MRPKTAMVALGAAGALLGGWISAAIAGEADWFAHVRAEHPRMFFNRETWPQVKSYTLAAEQEYYGKLKGRVAGFPAKADHEKFRQGANVKYGPYAQMCAFVWLMEGDRAALEKAKDYLKEGVKFYLERSSAKQAVNWYSCDRVCALTTYDWIHDELAPEERKEIGLGFLKHYRDATSGRSFPRQNRSGIESGFYGVTNLPWYLGLAFHRDGIDDAEAERLLREGYDLHLKLLAYRAQAAGDDGGMATLSLGYGFGFYPWSEFNFMHTVESACGVSLADRFTHMSLYPNWAYWNYIPPGLNYELADAHHLKNEYPEGFLDMHLLQVAHFWAKVLPERAQFALWVRENILKNRNHDDYWWPCAPFYLHRCAELPEPAGPDQTWPLARHLENMGVVFMRSGWTDRDTYAVYRSGGLVSSHGHYDQGHFTIYRQGFLALDTGTYGDRERSPHLTEYLYRTVAHNSILIRSRQDQAAKVWGGPGKTLDGGQCATEARTLAFATNRLYTYVATDLTPAYFPGKAKEVVRQFLFVHPDHFVICDRVTSAAAEEEKLWLLHTGPKPELSTGNRSFRVEGAEKTEGRLIGRTIFPEDAELELVGGPGKEYWSAGKNWPASGPRGDSENMGQWRLEVKSGAPRQQEIFLHLLRVGDKSLHELGPAEAVRAGGRVGVKFRTAQGETVATFNAEGVAGGHIQLGDVVRDLSATVQPQEGLARTTR